MTLYKIESAKFMHKYVNKKLPDYFQNYFNKVSGNHGYPLELQQMMTSLFHFSGQIVAKNHLNIKDQNYGILFPKIWLN